MLLIILRILALSAELKRSYKNFILEVLWLFAVAKECFTILVLEILVLLEEAKSHSRELVLSMLRLSVRAKNYLVGESLLVILTDFTKLTLYLILFFICYVVFFGTVATIIVVPKEELVQTFMTAHEYDYFSWFLSLPIDVQRNFFLWFLFFVLFVHYSDFYGRR